MDKLAMVDREGLRAKVPAFTPGDTVRVHIKAFEGVVIARKGGGRRETFTVRRVSHGIGVERTFPLHSPRVERIDVVRRGKARRAKLYFLRGKVGKAARIKEQR